MTTVTMKAVDTLHLSEVKAGMILADENFAVSDATAKELEERGLAKRVRNAPTEPKAETLLANKMEQAPANKSAVKPKA